LPFTSSTPMNYGRAIRLVRSARGLSQKKLAKDLGTDPSFVSHLERNKRVPSVETLQSLGEALKIPVYLLVFLASDQEDLHGIPQDQAQLFGRELLHIFTHDHPSRKR
jgi:transcriptional regulator with XRE-family HTH domain